jgi:hypothetical protein
MAHWRDITTVPKDGTYVLLWELVPPGRWDVFKDPAAAPGARTTVGRWVWTEASAGEWLRYGVGRICADRLTHWMPLPGPPVPDP